MTSPADTSSPFGPARRLLGFAAVGFNERHIIGKLAGGASENPVMAN